MTDIPFRWSPSDLDRRLRHDLHHLLHATRRHSHDRGGHEGFPRGGFGPGRGFAFGGPWFAPGRRAGRGDIRAAILALLGEQAMHGYQIIQELERRSGGHWRPSPGSVYPTLQQLQDEGLVTAVEQDGGRRVFELTDAGRAEAKDATAAAPWDTAAGGEDDEVTAMRTLFVQLAAATWQVAQTGNAKQRAAASELLRETRRRLYQLLADDADTAR